ncbi:angiotensin-converting enzyme isoform X1 [Plutella xylostella]|uniref:angiotensin-converting enzyme isoform X1 n=1 Tax=Plutella xylostella TaxID=51655 RepID=UPI002032B25E|nr:angiotensin-converting enzyme isoform X1 [Plutella xylostella]
MLLWLILCLSIIICIVQGVQFPSNAMSEVLSEEKSIPTRDGNNSDIDDGSRELDIDVVDEIREKKFLDDAMKAVLDPNSIISHSNYDIVSSFKNQLKTLDNANISLNAFMDEMDQLSLEVCKTSQAALWEYLTNINSEIKKNKMIQIAAEEDEIKKHYWNTLKKRYVSHELSLNDPTIQRKIRIIKERAINVQMPQSKLREEIETMQRIWSRVTVCAYNSTCSLEDSARSMSDPYISFADVIKIFKTSDDTDELVYYWKAFRDVTGKKIRPIFKEYVARMNSVAIYENFTDAADMWQYAFQDDNFVKNVDRIWSEIKPLYDTLHRYVRGKLATHYKNDMSNGERNIPAHILGNLWAQDWQAIYPKVVAYPGFPRPQIQDHETITSKNLFDAIDEFHTSLGFESAKDSFEDIQEITSTANCLPSSHDMCDGVHYKIKWCGGGVSDVVTELSRAARLLGHVQYFKHYRNQPPLYRDGPIPGFHDAISDIVAVQLTTPEHLQTLNFVTTDASPEATMNHLLWQALEKLPLMGFAYVLDRWRWDVFGNSSLKDWNAHWWELRMKETRISAPVPRDENDLDAASKYHVVSHVQYITYLVSHVLEFQILLSLCRQRNHSGPLHECSLRGDREAGRKLSEGMALGASENWRSVLKSITGQTELSTEGILEYFDPLQKFLNEENLKMPVDKYDFSKIASIVVGIGIVVLTVSVVIIYCVRKYNMCLGTFAACGIGRNGSLDIATHDMPQNKKEDLDSTRVCEDKV